MENANTGRDGGAKSVAPRKCSTKACNEDAFIRVFWPGQVGDHCATHALGLQNLATHMGFALSVALIVEVDP